MSLTELVIFVASPSDCTEERQRVRAAAESVTEALGTQLDVRLRVTGWEQQPPDLGRPQGQINPLVDSCDIFVGLMKRRWGTATGTHSSGFLEEFERALSMRAAGGGKPRVALWFGSIPDDVASDPGEQLKAVLDFQERVRNERLALYDVFDGPSDLVTKLVLYFSRVVAQVSAADEKPEVGTATAKPVSEEDGLDDDDLDEARQQIAAVADALATTVRGQQGEPAADSDRLLLIALGLQRDDGILVPVHAINRLFNERESIALSVMEHKIWLKTMLSDIATGPESSRVIPGFEALSPAGPDQLSEDLVEMTQADDSRVAAGALRLLGELKLRPDALWGDGSRLPESINRWTIAVGNAAPTASSYAASVAQPSDKPLLAAVAEATGHEGIVALENALGGQYGPLVELVSNAYSPEEWQVKRVRDAISHFNPAELISLIGEGRIDKSIRAEALAEAIRSNTTLTQEAIASAVLDHDLADIIFQAVKARQLSKEEVAAALGTIKDESTRDHLKSRLPACSKSGIELLGELNTSPGPGRIDALTAASWSTDPILVERARSIYDSDAEEIVAPFLELGNWDDSHGVISYLRDISRARALRILTRQDEPADEDIERLLREVDRGIRLLKDDVGWLLLRVARSDHSDRLTALALETQGGLSSNLMTRSLELGGITHARALRSSGKAAAHQEAGLFLANTLDSKDPELHELMYDKDHSVRYVASLRSADGLSREEVLGLMLSYIESRSQYYYNVVAALDRRLLTLEREVSKPA